MDEVMIQQYQQECDGEMNEEKRTKVLLWRGSDEVKTVEIMIDKVHCGLRLDNC